MHKAADLPFVSEVLIIDITYNFSYIICAMYFTESLAALSIQWYRKAREESNWISYREYCSRTIRDHPDDLRSLDRRDYLRSAH